MVAKHGPACKSGLLVRVRCSGRPSDPLSASFGGSQGDGLVTGVFANGKAFAVHLRGDNTASRVRLVTQKKKEGDLTPAKAPNDAK